MARRQNLQTQANAQQGPAFFDVLQNRLDQSPIAQRFYRIGKRPHPWQHQLIRLLYMLRLGNYLRSKADMLKCLLHRAEVGHVIIENA